ncbi:asparagine synthase-related protein [Streptomyces sp. NBC_01142]|uniref:asparagine synthase-related protein n=1 Tax=Streptomyces sp. NBC_01142 TaxID=2975865 RepID=UPI002257D0B3|nr:asparagine synthase-related protein [Streptomyces sp. NBC_01142]MCX4818402.1 asparagine synthase-related protein [Streptomyces sp. NBC_01142]
MLGHLRDFFVVLPDTAEGQAVAGHLGSEAEGVLTIPYASGRPWIVARLLVRRISHVSRGSDSLVLIGPNRVPDAALAELLGQARDSADLHRRLTRLPGLHHVISRMRDETCVRGTASGHRRVYHAAHAGGRVVSDRPAVLAHLTGAELDDGALALRLLDFVPHPLRERPVWRGLEEIDPAYALTLRDGAGGPKHTVRRWWQPPTPELRMEEGAPLIAAALADSVRAHVEGHTRISCELSGGLDSTSVTFLAQQAGAQETTLLTVAARDSRSEDEMWARRGVEEARKDVSRTIDHRVIPAGDAPLFYADLRGTAGELLDEPFPVAPARARAHMLLGRAAATGSEYHLTGYGGDELFNGLASACQDLLPGKPLKAWNRISALRHQSGWPLWPTVRGLLFPPAFSTWLAASVTDGPGTGGLASDARRPQVSWGMQQAMRPWFTGDAKALIRDEFRSAAERAEPLSPRPGRHMDIDTVRLGARYFQAMEDLGMTVGLPVAAPFFDDRVIEAVLAVRVEDRVIPWRYKPLLVEAMREVVPASLLARTTKDHMSADDVQGLREHAPELRELWTGSRLAERGLIDAKQLRRLADDPFSPVLQQHPIDSTVSCEAWLRTVEGGWPAEENSPKRSEKSEAVS